MATEVEEAKEENEDTEQLLDVLSREVRELSLGCTAQVARLKGPLQPLQFLRDFVLPNRPCIITDAISHWPALRLWSNDYLYAKLADHEVSCHFTPDGRADAVVDTKVGHGGDGYLRSLQRPGVSCDSGIGGSLDLQERERERQEERVGRGVEWSDVEGLVFASALVEVLRFPEALDHVLGSSTAGREVAYLQQQNNCFSAEFSALSDDAEMDIPWASEALGCMPEAVNLWIGSQESVTSFHKDHYENLYAVVAGEKHFTLLPPTDVHRMYVREYPTAHYKRTDSGNLVLERGSPPTMVPWVSVDPFTTSPQQGGCSSFPRYFDGPPPFQCTVRAGELLYLPSMWFHHVRQTPDSEDRTIALNYWYDMQFDIKYAYYNLVESLAATL